MDSLAQLPEMQQVLEASTCITLDVEWKPKSFTPRDFTSAPVATAGASAEFMQSGRSSPLPPVADVDHHGATAHPSDSALHENHAAHAVSNAVGKHAKNICIV